MTAPARRAAHSVLRLVNTHRLDLSSALAKARTKLADRRDRALTDEIATGTLRWQGALDALLSQVSSRSLEKIDDDILDLLRAATYQLLYLDRIPRHAVVHDAVSLTRTIGKKSASTFVNAVLRVIVEKNPNLLLPKRPSFENEAEALPKLNQALDYLAITLSHPRWLVERWLNRHGFEQAESWVRFNNKPAPIALRVNSLKTSTTKLISKLSTLGVQLRPGIWSKNTLVVTHGNPVTTKLANEGLFFVQNEASQLIAELVHAKPGDKVLDTCAAPGGKTVAIAGRMAGHGLLVAGDIRARRVSLLSETLSRLAPDSAHVIQLDLNRSLPLAPLFDWVLLDAPCSCLGTLRSDPEVRWRRSLKDLQTLSATQKTFLNSASAVLAPGGRLVYSTCSSEPEENEHVIQNFLSTHKGFSVEKPTNKRIESLVDNNGFFKTLPYRDNLEGFFAAILRNENS